MIVSSWYRIEFFSGIMINDSAHHCIWHKNGGYSMEMMIRRRVKMMMIVIIMLIMMMMVTMTMTNILVIWETQGGHHTIWNGPTVRTLEAQWPFWASEFSTACEVMLIMMKMMQNIVKSLINILSLKLSEKYPFPCWFCLRRKIFQSMWMLFWPESISK